MAEKNNALTADERMEAATKILNDYEAHAGLPTPVSPGSEEELQEYFSMSRDEIERLSAEGCASIAYRLAQYALYIQRLNNRECARLNWAKAVLSESIAKDYSNYSKYTKYEVRVALMAEENTYVDRIQKIINAAQLRLDRLSFLSNNIKYLSEVMIANQRVKKNVGQ